MRVLVTGGTGGVGARVTARLLERGHDVLVLTRHAGRARAVLDPRVVIVEGDPSRAGDWQDVVASCDGVAHLAAHSIWERRWSAREKVLIRTSRIEATTRVAEAVARGRGRVTLVSASAVGQYYGAHGDAPVGDAGQRAETFIATVCSDWERACAPALDAGARVSYARIGVVLSSAVERMAPPFRWFLGGIPGSGTQWVPWVDPRDLADMLLFALTCAELSGPFNAVGPEPVRMRELAHTLGRVLGRPVWVPLPGLVIAGMLGEVACMALLGARAIPEKLQRLGFRHGHADLETSLRDALAGRA
jgi:uncharacterized protein